MKKILYVEDDLSMRTLLTYILKDICELDICTSPTEYYEKFVDKPYSLIIMDIGFLNSLTDGIELSQNIKNMELHKNTPIIAYTAYIYSKLSNKIYEAEKNGIFSEIIPKPFESIDDFRNIVLNYISDEKLPCPNSDEKLPCPNSD